MEKGSLLSHARGTGMYLNHHGAFYWLFEDGDSTYSLLSYDMRNDAFDMIDGPNNPFRKMACFCRGYENDNPLAMFLFDRYCSSEDECVDLMVGKNDNGCWEKHLSIDTSFVGGGIAIPLGLWKDNQLLFLSSANKLCLYDPDTKEIKEFEVFHNSRTQIFYYKENLVSIKRGVT